MHIELIQQVFTDQKKIRSLTNSVEQYKISVDIVRFSSKGL